MTSAQTNRPAVTLSSEQAQLVLRLQRRLAALTDRAVWHLERDDNWMMGSGRLVERRYPPDWLKHPRLPTVLGILGPRGAGKSTVMLGALRIWDTCLDDKPLRDRCRQFANLARILDCSLVPEHVPLGLAILQHLKVCLEKPLEDLGRERDQELNLAFEELQRAFVAAGPRTAQVAADMALSPSHFAAHTARASLERFALPDLVGRWLELAAQAVGVAGFVVGVDDVDLAEGEGPRGLLRSLLDELHQPRLMLVLSADLALLEQRIERPGINPRPDRTVTPLTRALLQKVLPLVNRQILHPWPVDQRLSFPPGSDRTGGEPERLSVRSLLARLPAEWPPEYRSPALLPGWPRGLEDLLQKLVDIEALKREDEARPESERRPPRPQEFVGFLAEARGEQELGRTLATQPIEDWARTFVWPADAFGEAGWRRLVVAAAERRPLRQLGVEPGELPIGELEPVPSVDWVEMLVNVGLQSGRLGPAELVRRLPGVSGRLAACQVERTLLRDELSDELFWGGGSFFAAFAWSRWEARRDERGNLPVEVPVQMGFGPFLEAVGARRRSWPSDLLDGLFLRRQDLMTVRQEDWREALGTSRDATAARLLPRNVRALLLFVDALSRAPWRELSRSLRERPPQAWVMLAAGLVRAAYLVAVEQRVDALNRDLEVQRRQGTRPGEEPPDLPVAVGLVRSEADRPFVDAITGSAASPLLEWQNEEVEAAFAALVAARDELPAPLDPGAQPAVRGWDWELQLSSYNALTEALSAFADSPYFSLLVEPPRTGDGFGLGAADTGEDLETPD